jgi:hypothetical protein
MNDDEIDRDSFIEFVREHPWRTTPDSELFEDVISADCDDGENPATERLFQEATALLRDWQKRFPHLLLFEEMMATGGYGKPRYQQCLDIYNLTEAQLADMKVREFELDALLERHNYAPRGWDCLSGVTLEEHLAKKSQ